MHKSNNTKRIEMRQLGKVSSHTAQPLVSASLFILSSETKKHVVPLQSRSEKTQLQITDSAHTKTKPNIIATCILETHTFGGVFFFYQSTEIKDHKTADTHIQ